MTTHADPHSQITSSERRSTLELLCAWSGATFMVVFGVGFVVLARFIPPPDPSWSAEELLQFVDDHRFGIRAGMVIVMFASALLIPFYLYISAHMARIEPGFPLLAAIQGIAGAILTVFFILTAMIWATMAYREDVSAESVRLLSDFGWLIFVMVVSTFLVQCLSIAAAGLRYATRDDIAFPRWFMFLTIWMGVTGCGGSLAVFFMDGPFAWNGVVGFYLPLPIFAVWMSTYTWVLHRSTGLGVTRGRR